jgi:hypothetical protein
MTVRHGNITKRGQEELRRTLVEVVMRMSRLKESKATGRSITAAARKAGVIIRHMLNEGKIFDESLTAEGKLTKEAEAVSKTAYAKDKGSLKKPSKGETASLKTGESRFELETTGVTGEKRKKPANRSCDA